MTLDPRWHGWATPENVCEMMREMLQFLKNSAPSDYDYMKKYIDCICQNDISIICKNHPNRNATSGIFNKLPYEYYCEECWGKRNANL